MDDGSDGNATTTAAAAEVGIVNGGRQSFAGVEAGAGAGAGAPGRQGYGGCHDEPFCMTSQKVGDHRPRLSVHPPKPGLRPSYSSPSYIPYT